MTVSQTNTPTNTATVPATATAVAHPNVALIKYWGKRDAALNLPATGSISVTLRGLATRTTVTFSPGFERDRLLLNGQEAATDVAKISRVLDLIRRRAGLKAAALVDSSNDFPTGAGLASSASGFAALVIAAAAAAKLDLSRSELSALARQGSGSAARSIFGGFVEMTRGSRADGTDAVACQLLSEDAWPLAVLVAVTTHDKKSIGSTVGMESTRETSPFWQAWLDSADNDLLEMRRAIAARDFEKLGALTEHSALKMHGLMLSTRPALLYWRGATVEVLHAVQGLRRAGIAAFCSIDAGPQVKVLCQPGDQARVRTTLAAIPGVVDLLVATPGAGARVETPSASNVSH